jgi:cell division protein FtsW (lipid II flippase)
MNIIGTLLINIAEKLFASYIWSKRDVLKAFARKQFLYLLLIASSAFIITMLRKNFDKQQLVIILIILAIAFVVTNNKNKSVAAL